MFSKAEHTQHFIRRGFLVCTAGTVNVPPHVLSGASIEAPRGIEAESGLSLEGWDG